MNRAEIKETAKSYMRQNNNHGGMVGVEILYNLLFDAATAAIDINFKKLRFNLFPSLLIHIYFIN